MFLQQRYFENAGVFSKAHIYIDIGIGRHSELCPYVVSFGVAPAPGTTSKMPETSGQIDVLQQRDIENV